MTTAQHKIVHRAAGFTLVEMLVAISVLSLMSVLIVSGLKLAGFLSSRVNRQSEGVADIAMVQDTVRQLIEQTYPAMVRRDEGPAVTTFRGDTQALELTAPLPHRFALGGLYRIRLAVDASRQTLTLSWRLERNEAAFAMASGLREVPLLAGVTEARFAYFGQPRGASGAAWHDRWEDQPGLPPLVRIDLQRPARHPAWPTLHIAPRVDVDATCVFDPLTRGCRGR